MMYDILVLAIALKQTANKSEVNFFDARIEHSVISAYKQLKSQFVFLELVWSMHLSIPLISQGPQESIQGGFFVFLMACYSYTLLL